ncbi:hypothetical protein OG331_47845 [Streptomyces sp. NBC_01017]|uniref:hypothetical protein n=1 Tax=Streptomyces sp. NBC_01017 TaxID=2903721 RepID=UPI0038697B3A|nr:hypothetical protein OG331_04135 [Streptomyces sp. NBC_01017]WSV34774.1 hypothetical protein OG331_47845 [Streptomyces sp. NBC_01017]
MSSVQWQPGDAGLEIKPMRSYGGTNPSGSDGILLPHQKKKPDDPYIRTVMAQMGAIESTLHCGRSGPPGPRSRRCALEVVVGRPRRKEVPSRRGVVGVRLSG